MEKFETSLTPLYDRLPELRSETGLAPVLLTIPQVAKCMGLCRAKVYQLIAHEQLPVVRIGRAVRVMATSLQEWIEKREIRYGLPER